SDQHSGLRRKFEVLALARDDIGGTAGQAEAEATRDVAEDRTDERAATGPDGRADNIALDVMLFLNDLSFVHFQIFAALAFRLRARECELVSCREATPGRCLGAFRWRGGPGIPAEPGRGEDGEELHPRLEYSIPEMRGAAF